jgi:hypothetical protein
MEPETSDWLVARDGRRSLEDAEGEVRRLQRADGPEGQAVELRRMRARADDDAVPAMPIRCCTCAISILGLNAMQIRRMSWPLDPPFGPMIPWLIATGHGDAVLCEVDHSVAFVLPGVIQGAQLTGTWVA